LASLQVTQEYKKRGSEVDFGYGLDLEDINDNWETNARSNLVVVVLTPELGGMVIGWCSSYSRSDL